MPASTRNHVSTVSGLELQLRSLLAETLDAGDAAARHCYDQGRARELLSARERADLTDAFNAWELARRNLRALLQARSLDRCAGESEENLFLGHGLHWPSGKKMEAQT